MLRLYAFWIFFLRYFLLHQFIWPYRTPFIAVPICMLGCMYVFVSNGGAVPVVPCQTHKHMHRMARDERVYREISLHFVLHVLCMRIRAALHSTATYINEPPLHTKRPEKRIRATMKQRDVQRARSACNVNESGSRVSRLTWLWIFLRKNFDTTIQFSVSRCVVIITLKCAQPIRPWWVGVVHIHNKFV